jgi:hypothetical protein
MLRELKLAVETRNDAEAAAALLAHSVKWKHPRLAIFRYFVALQLGVPGFAEEHAYCQASILCTPADTIGSRRARAEKVHIRHAF